MYTYYSVIITAHGARGAEPGPRMALEVDTSTGQPVVTDLHYQRSESTDILDAWRHLDLDQVLAGFPKTGTALTTPVAPGITTQPAQLAQDVPAGSVRCDRCERVLKARSSGGLPPHRTQPHGGVTCRAPKTPRQRGGGLQKGAKRTTYREAPDNLAELMTRFGSSPKAIATHLNVPEYTVNGWIRRLRKRDQLRKLPIIDPSTTPGQA